MLEFAITFVVLWLAFFFAIRHGRKIERSKVS